MNILSPKTLPLTPAQTAVALGLVSEMDFLRLKAIARLHARGLPPDVGWEDLLQEAFTRAIVGTRPMPEGVPPVAFFAGVIRSLKSEYWRRALRERGAARTLSDPDGSQELEPADAAPPPERALIAREELAAIERLFADDAQVLRLIEGLGEGRSAAEIRSAAGLTWAEYDSARKRMRRTLLRKGLTWDK